MASKKVLLKVARELQKVLKISDPPIDMEQDAPGLTTQILEAAGLIKYEADDDGPADDISASTLKVIGKLQGTANEDAADDAQVEEPLKAEGRPIEKPKAEKKEKVEKKAEPKAKKEKAEPKVKKEKKAPVPKRVLTVFDCITKKNQPIEEVCSKANSKIIAAGGKDNMKQTTHVFSVMVDLLVHAGVIAVAGDKVKLL